MTKEKVIEEIKNYNYNYPSGLSKECRDYIIKTLEQEPKWIPITERLPEVEMATRCLVTVDGCGIDDFTAIRSYFPDTKDFNDIVTAWMPLPEPYKAESENT